MGPLRDFKYFHILSDHIELLVDEICCARKGETAPDYQARLCTYETASLLMHMNISDYIPISYWDEEVPEPRSRACRFGNSRCICCVKCPACIEKKKIHQILTGERTFPNIPKTMKYGSFATRCAEDLVKENARRAATNDAPPSNQAIHKWKSNSPQKSPSSGQERGSISPPWTKRVLDELNEKAQAREKARLQAERRAQAKARADALKAEQAARSAAPRPSSRPQRTRKVTAKVAEAMISNTTTTTADEASAAGPSTTPTTISVPVTTNGEGRAPSRTIILRLRPELLAQFSNTQPASATTNNTPSANIEAPTNSQNSSATVSDETINAPVIGSSNSAPASAPVSKPRTKRVTKPKSKPKNTKRKRDDTQESSDTIEESQAEVPVDPEQEEKRASGKYSLRTKRAKKTFHDDIIDKKSGGKKVPTEKD